MRSRKTGNKVLRIDVRFIIFRYANRAKNIKNHARINEDPKDAKIRDLQNEMERLKKQLEESSFRCSKKCSLRKISLSDGVEEDAEGSEDEIDENGKPVARKRALRVSEARRVEIERQIDEERRRLLEDTEKTAKQKEKIARDLKQKELELQAMLDSRKIR